MAHRLVDEDAPEVQGLVVTALQQHDAVTAAFGKHRVAVELTARRSVEFVEVPHAEGLRVDRTIDVEQVLNEHAEGCAPVADVVLAPHVVTEEPEHAGERVADERAAQVSDVHLLGDIRRRVVDDHRGGVGNQLDAQAPVRRKCRHLAGEEVVGQRQVDEPGPADLDLGADVVEGGRRHHLLGHLARRPADLLAQGQGAVRLEVGAVGGPQHRVGPGPNGVEGGLQPLEEDAGGVGHPSFSHARTAPEPGCRDLSPPVRPCPRRASRSDGRGRRSRARAARSRRGRRR